MKEIEAMNIEELRNALKESESKRTEAEKNLEKVSTDKKNYYDWWQESVAKVKKLQQKLEAVKSFASIL